MKKTVITALVLAAAVLLFSFSGRTTIGPDEIGVRTGPGKALAVFPAGERPLVLPGVHRLIRLTTKPVAFVMAGVGAVTVTTPKGEQQIACRLRYQVKDAALLVRNFGSDEPQTLLENDLRQRMQEEFGRRLAAAPHLLDSPTSRIPFIAESHAALNNALQNKGVAILSLELLDW